VSHLSEQSKIYNNYANKASDFIRNKVIETKSDGVIFGLSGGIDSAVVAFLCQKALGNHCLAMLMPNESFTPKSETEDAITVAEQLKIRHVIRPIQFISNLFTVGDKGVDRLVVGNLNARIRANMLYYEGQKKNYLVVGTDDRSEYLIGYFTKYGDGASDILPIADLYKTEVQILGNFLGVPDEIVRKRPSPNLWANHEAFRELGCGYDTIDVILKGIFDEKLSPRDVSKKYLIPYKTVTRILSFNVKSMHKRELPPICKLKH
jgi:NAD+ synthase